MGRMNGRCWGMYTIKYVHADDSLGNTTDAPRKELDRSPDVISHILRVPREMRAMCLDLQTTPACCNMQPSRPMLRKSLVAADGPDD